MAHKLPENDPLNKYLNPPVTREPASDSPPPIPTFSSMQKPKSHSKLMLNIILWGGLVAMIGVFFAVGNMLMPKDMDTAEKVASVLTVDTTSMTPLSALATRNLRIGMPRESVIQLLGQANWAAIPGDSGRFSPTDKTIGLELYWENKECRRILVSFGHNPYRVIGWDEGSGYCDRKGPLPDNEEHSCTRPDRAALCR